MSHSLSSHFYRGCILYAMVCGYLPYGDDTRVAQMIDRPLHFNLSSPKVSVMLYFIHIAVQYTYLFITIT